MLRNGKLKKTDPKFIAKHTCGAVDCDEHMQFRATRDAVATMHTSNCKPGKFITVSCSKCGKRSVMSARDYERWQGLFTAGELVAVDTTFVAIFEVE